MIVHDIALTFESGISCAAAVHLLSVFGSAEKIYETSEMELVERAELKPEVARSLLKKQFHRFAEQEVQFVARNGITAIASTSPLYPRYLLECNDYPHVLYMKGDPQALGAPMLSMVGTRNVTTYGLSACNRLVEGLARLMPNLVVVSGLAFGVDVACHRAAINYGLRTVGVLANPLNSVYPSVHSSVADDMARRGGGVISELSSREHGSKARFLQRNRIIAGMSPGTIVVQSPESGGSMITASLVDGYNRCLMCPPANINEEQSTGTNRLLRSMKARMVCSGEDILEELGWLTQAMREARKTSAAPALDPAAQTVYDCICKNPKATLEEVESSTGIALQQLLAILLELEFGGYVRSLPGNKYEKF